MKTMLKIQRPMSKSLLFNDLSEYTPLEVTPDWTGTSVNPVTVFSAKGNQTHLGNLNTLFPIGENTTLRVNLYYLNDLRKQSVSQSNTIFLAADTIAYSEQIDNRFRDNRLFGTITLNRNAFPEVAGSGFDVSAKCSARGFQARNNQKNCVWVDRKSVV